MKRRDLFKASILALLGIKAGNSAAAAIKTTDEEGRRILVGEVTQTITGASGGTFGQGKVGGETCCQICGETVATGTPAMAVESDGKWFLVAHSVD